MSEGNRKYGWQIEVSPHNSTEILDQMEFLQKVLDIDSSGLVIPPEERQAIHEELIRLSELCTAAITEDINKRVEAEQQAAQRAARQADPWFQLWQFSHMNCALLWLMFLMVLFSLPMFASMSGGISSDSEFPVWCIMTVGSLAWAIWASSPQKG